MRLRIAPRIIAFCILFFSPNARAQWQPDGVPACTATGPQRYATIASDGIGGAIVAWTDYRTGLGDAFADIYVRRLDAAGIPQWAADGLAVCTTTGEQSGPAIIPDGTGGAIIAWQDTRSGNYDIYAQRVNATGVPQWTADGVAPIQPDHHHPLRAAGARRRIASASSMATASSFYRLNAGKLTESKKMVLLK